MVTKRPGRSALRWGALICKLWAVFNNERLLAACNVFGCIPCQGSVAIHGCGTPSAPTFSLLRGVLRQCTHVYTSIGMCSNDHTHICLSAHPTAVTLSQCWPTLMHPGLVQVMAREAESGLSEAAKRLLKRKLARVNSGEHDVYL